jgi:hypothetical protein
MCANLESVVCCNVWSFGLRRGHRKKLFPLVFIKDMMIFLSRNLHLPYIGSWFLPTHLRDFFVLLCTPFRSSLTRSMRMRVYLIFVPHNASIASITSLPAYQTLALATLLQHRAQDPRFPPSPTAGATNNGHEARIETRRTGRLRQLGWDPRLPPSFLLTRGYLWS